MFGKGSDKTRQGTERTRTGWFGRVSRLFERGRVDEALWEELEELLISADVGVSATEQLLDRVRERSRKEAMSDPAEVRRALKEEMVRLLSVTGVRPRFELCGDGPRVVIVVGVNGVGKTTSIAKLARMCREQGGSVLIAAADTFRAAAIDQLRLWAERAGADIVAHQPGSDPGAVVFDAVQAASHRGASTVIVDTAGRLHTKFNLMEELKKIARVVAKASPGAKQSVLLIVDATTGQNALSQARYFSEAVGVDGVFVAKLDGTAKGGIILAISDELRVPIVFLGTGERLDDIAPFDAEVFVDALFS